MAKRKWSRREERTGKVEKCPLVFMQSASLTSRLPAHRQVLATGVTKGRWARGGGEAETIRSDPRQTGRRFLNSRQEIPLTWKASYIRWATPDEFPPLPTSAGREGPTLVSAHTRPNTRTCSSVRSSELQATKYHPERETPGSRAPAEPPGLAEGSASRPLTPGAPSQFKAIPL